MNLERNRHGCPEGTDVSTRFVSATGMRAPALIISARSVLCAAPLPFSQLLPPWSCGISSSQFSVNKEVGAHYLFWLLGLSE